MLVCITTYTSPKTANATTSKSILLTNIPFLLPLLLSGLVVNCGFNVDCIVDIVDVDVKEDIVCIDTDGDINGINTYEDIIGINNKEDVAGIIVDEDIITEIMNNQSNISHTFNYNIFINNHDRIQ